MTAGGADVDEVDTVTLARAVLAVDGVAAMSAGPVGQFRSYLPDGSSVPGVRIGAAHLEINIVSQFGPALPELGTAIQAALASLIGGRTVTVTVDDIVLPGEPAPAGAGTVVEGPDSAREDESAGGDVVSTPTGEQLSEA